MSSPLVREEDLTAKSKVLIIGAGIAGLSLGAQILKHASKYYEPIIFEKAKCFEDLHTRGFVVNITSNAIYVLEGMGFDVQGQDFVFPAVLHDSRTKETRPLAVVEGIFDDPRAILAVERGPLQKLLMGKYIELGGEIRFDKCLVSVEQNNEEEGVGWKQEAFFSDGTSERGDVLVGADGVHSRVRKHLYSVLPEEKKEEEKVEEKPSPMWWRILKALFSTLLWIMCFCFCQSRCTKKEKKHKDEDKAGGNAMSPLCPPWEAIPTSWTALYGITSPIPRNLLDNKEEAGTMHWCVCETGGYSTYPLSNGRVFWIAHEVERFKPASSPRCYTQEQAREAMHRFDEKPYLNGSKFGELTAHTERLFKTRVHHGVFDHIADDAAGIALVGDAAHAAAIYVGQGAVLGIEESVVLVNGLLRKKWAELGLLPEQPLPPTKPSPSRWWGSSSKKTPEFEPILVGMAYYENERLDRCKSVASISWWLGWSLMGEEKFWRVIRDTLMRYWLPWMVKETKHALAKPPPDAASKEVAEDKDNNGTPSTKPQPTPRPKGNSNKKMKVRLRDRKRGKYDHWLFDAKFDVEEEVSDIEEEA